MLPKRKKRFKFRDEAGRTYKFDNDELITAWNIIDRVDKIDTASLYLRNTCHLNVDSFTTDEWWICCAALCQLYVEKYNGGANDSIWKDACTDFMELYAKGEVI